AHVQVVVANVRWRLGIARVRLLRAAGVAGCTGGGRATALGAAPRARQSAHCDFWRDWRPVWRPLSRRLYRRAACRHQPAHLGGLLVARSPVPALGGVHRVAALLLAGRWRRIEQPDTTAWLMRFDRITLLLELVVILCFLVSLGGVARAFL